jgi:hypothetical protein
MNVSIEKHTRIVCTFRATENSMALGGRISGNTLWTMGRHHHKVVGEEADHGDEMPSQQLAGDLCDQCPKRVILSLSGQGCGGRLERLLRHHYQANGNGIIRRVDEAERNPVLERSIAKLG